MRNRIRPGRRCSGLLILFSPWSVGRYGDIAGADNLRQNLIVPDLAEAAANGREYLPVIFPGFSWFNLNGGPLNQIPRNGGRLLGAGLQCETRRLQHDLRSYVRRSR